MHVMNARVNSKLTQTLDQRDLNASNQLPHKYKCICVQAKTNVM